MRIREVTDEWMDRVIQAAASPVCVVFGNTLNGRGLPFIQELDDVAQDFEDRIIFIWIDLAENPSALCGFLTRPSPTVIVFKLGRVAHTYVDVETPCQFHGVLEHFQNLKESP